MSLSDDQPAPAHAVGRRPPVRVAGLPTARVGHTNEAWASTGPPASELAGGGAQAPRDVSESPEASAVTIGQFFQLLRRRLVALVLVLVLCIAAAVALFFAAAPSYVASSKVQVAPITANGGSGLAKDISTITESRIVTSSSVADSAAKTLKYSGTITSLLSNVSVTSPLNSQVLVITYTASNAQRSADGANAFAQAYLSYRRSVAQSQLDSSIKLTSARLVILDNQLTALSGVQGSARQVGALQTQITQLSNQLNGYRTIVINPGQVFGVARAPASPSSPRPVLYLAGGALFGLILGVLLAIILDRRDDKVRGADQLELSLGAPTLATSPRAAGSAKASLEAVRVWEVASTEADAYRTIATKLSTQMTGRGTRSLLVTRGGVVTEGSAPAHLAATFARQGLSTALLATDEALGRTDEVDAAHRGQSMHALVPVDDVADLYVVALGEEVNLDSTLRDGDQLISDMLDRVDVVVLDAVNLDLPSSALTLGRLTRSAVVVAVDGRTSRAELGHNLRELAQVGTRPLGGILLARRARIRRRRRRRSSRSTG